jgi:diguanylate cyclase (GGDEF)-like protein
LQGRLRESDTLARLGGDEFGVLLEGCSLERAKLIAADLLAAVRDHRFTWDGRAFNVGVSIGLAIVSAETGSRAEIFSAPTPPATRPRNRAAIVSACTAVAMRI